MSEKIFRADIPIRSDILLKRGNFPLIDLWGSRLGSTLKQRTEIQSLLDGGNNSALEKIGFPADIVPVMKLWREKGPDILSSVSHPEEMDLYKVFGLFNLKLFVEQARSQGFIFPKVLINYYDTIPFLKQVLKPLKFVTFGNDFDLFGIKNKGESSLQKIPAEELSAISTQFEGAIPDIAKLLWEQLHNEIRDESIKISAARIRTSKNRDITTIQKGLTGRLEVLKYLFDEIALRHDQTTLSKILMEFQRDLMDRIFGRAFSSLVEEECGFTCELFSENQQFLDLVRTSLLMIVEARGLSMVRDLVEPWEGLGTNQGKREILTIDEKENFAVMDHAGHSEQIGEDEVIKLLAESKTLPLAKLESMAMICGGNTLHFGAEYGVRKKVLDILQIGRRKKIKDIFKIKNNARSYLENLRIGVDREHGNNGIVIENTESNISLVLCYVLFGPDGMKELIADRLGQTNQPLVVSMKDFRTLAAKSLLSASLDPDSDISYFSKDQLSTGLYSY